MDGNQAFLIGNVLGKLMELERDYGSLDTKVEPVYDSHGNYCDSILVTRPSGEYLITITKVE